MATVDYDRLGIDGFQLLVVLVVLVLFVVASSIVMHAW
jgi:hypothetical protein